MKIVSWNINGIRAAVKKGFVEWINQTKPDIVCLQEIKANEDQVPKEILDLDGYHGFYHSCTIKKGYSGVAVLSRIPPNNVNKHIGVEEIDGEGRILEIDYGAFILYGCYFPNGSREHLRVPYKMRFYDALFARCQQQRAEGKNIVVCGDYNTAHHEIDLARPKENQHTTGFLAEEREKLDWMVQHGWIDTFREFYPDEPEWYSYWDQVTRARERNVGWRIDYHWITPELRPALKNAWISTDVYGSDHAPVGIVLHA
jgi:exodeoxyribonuclease III